SRLWANRVPVSGSGYTTRSAPTIFRISPWSGFWALATTRLIPSRLSNVVARMLERSSVPMATTATSKSCAPSFLRTSLSVASAMIACVTSSAMSSIARASRSIASTSCPSRSNSRATALPNRPTPITKTCRPTSPLSAALHVLTRIADAAPGRPRRQCQRQRQRSEATGEHDRDQEQSRAGAELGSDPGREAHRAEAGDRLEGDIDGIEGLEHRQPQSDQEDHRDGEEDD